MLGHNLAVVVADLEQSGPRAKLSPWTAGWPVLASCSPWGEPQNKHGLSPLYVFSF